VSCRVCQNATVLANLPVRTHCDAPEKYRHFFDREPPRETHFGGSSSPSWIHLFHNLKQRTQTFGMCGSPIELDAETLGDGVFRIEPSLQSGSDQPPSLSPSIGVLRSGPSRRSATRHSSTGHSFTRHFVHNFGEGVHTLCQFKTSPGYRPCRLHKVLNV
jgi:hypothetical protein